MKRVRDIAREYIIDKSSLPVSELLSRAQRITFGYPMGRDDLVTLNIDLDMSKYTVSILSSVLSDKETNKVLRLRHIPLTESSTSYTWAELSWEIILDSRDIVREDLLVYHHSIRGDKKSYKIKTLKESI